MNVRPRSRSSSPPAATRRSLSLATAVALALSLGTISTASAQSVLDNGNAHKRVTRTGSINAAQTTPAAKPDDGITYCNQMEAKPLGLKFPNGKSLVQFDKCYRGRLHNHCLAKALSVMFSSLQQDYDKLIETNYPSITSTNSVCQFTAGQLTQDLETAKAFTVRYKALVTGYDERLKCTDLVMKSLEKASFPDMPNIEKTVKTMADELKSDVAGFSKERQAADELLAKVTEAHKALEVHSDVHRAMCITAEVRTAPKQ